MSSIEKSAFATMPTKQFLGHLANYNIVPNESEINSAPVVGATLESGIETSILKNTGQRWGESGSAK